MPDVEIREQRYRDERPAEHFAPFHARTRSGEPNALVYEAVRAATMLNALAAFRARAVGSENVPGGPVILAPNHASFMDHFFTAGFIRRRVQFMAKSQLFTPGPGQWIFTHGGVFPVRRGVADEEAFITAFAVLQRGGALAMYCEGGRSRTGELAATARPGIGRLALQSGAPVVPVAILGSHQARNWRHGHLPKVIVRYGPPLQFDAEPDPPRERQQDSADTILERIREMHREMVALGPRGTLRAARDRRLRDPGPGIGPST